MSSAVAAIAKTYWVATVTLGDGAGLCMCSVCVFNVYIVVYFRDSLNMIL